MNISFHLNTSATVFKDIWGYKSDTPYPGFRVDSLKTYCSLLPQPPLKSEYTEQDNIICDLVNGRPATISVDVNTSGCANVQLLSTPGALTLGFMGMELPITSELLDFEPAGRSHPWARVNFNTRKGTATCKIQIQLDAAEHAPPNGNPLLFNPNHQPYGRIHTTELLGIIKHLVNNPGKYYISRNLGFYVEAPKDIDDLAKIYGWERTATSPAPEQVLMDPCIYADCDDETTRKFARALISGNMEMYMRG